MISAVVVNRVSEIDSGQINHNMSVVIGAVVNSIGEGIKEEH